VTPSARSAPIVAARLAARLSAFAKGGASSLSAILAQMSSAVRVAETLDLGMFLCPITATRGFAAASAALVRAVMRATACGGAFHLTT
jgi:hypothetical protein